MGDHGQGEQGRLVQGQSSKGSSSKSSSPKGGTSKGAKSKGGKSAKDVKPNVFVRFGRYLRDVWAELKRVVWPDRTEVINSSIVVIVTVLFFVAFTFVVDQHLDAVREAHRSDRRVAHGEEVVRHPHLLGLREQGEDQSRAPDRVHGHGATRSSRC